MNFPFIACTFHYVTCANPTNKMSYFPFFFAKLLTILLDEIWLNVLAFNFYIVLKSNGLFRKRLGYYQKLIGLSWHNVWFGLLLLHICFIYRHPRYRNWCLGCFSTTQDKWELPPECPDLFDWSCPDCILRPWCPRFSHLLFLISFKKSVMFSSTTTIYSLMIIYLIYTYDIRSAWLHL
jgi:hypothetical protein